MPALPRYPRLTPTTLRLAASLVTGRPRSFRRDAREFVGRLRPVLRIEGASASIPDRGGVIVANHYFSPTFRAWWIALALTAAVDEEIHWVMAAAWTYPDPLRSRLITPLTRTLFERLAKTYGFTSMPPMPPAAREAAARARAVREVLRHVARESRPIIGLVPEGGDTATGDLAVPPPGVGRFLALLASRGLPLLPAGVFESDGGLCLRFGLPFTLPVSGDLSPEIRDRQAADAVMRAIADCLPESLRGIYRKGEAIDARR
jgi:hypothetical protein